MSSSNERERAAAALQGLVVPRPGDEGVFIQEDPFRILDVLVDRVSASGRTVWLKFRRSSLSQSEVEWDPKSTYRFHRTRASERAALGAASWRPVWKEVPRGIAIFTRTEA